MATSTSPKPRLPEDEIRIEMCEESDAEEIAAGLYASFPPSAWDKWEPPAIREPVLSKRISRMSKRIIAPSFSHPNMHWVKAVHVPTNRIIGVAGWQGPGHPLHTVWRRSAADYYGWREKYNWSEADIEEMWTGVDMETWETSFTNDDKVRKEVLGDEEHWYLAPLYTLPEFQGRGVGKKLLQWAIEKADKTEPVTPLYLEASVMGKPVYLRVGFDMVGEKNMLRRGPKTESGDAEKRGVSDDANKNGIEVAVEQPKEADV